MRYLVVSDNHGDREILVKLFEEYRGKVDAIFHCGDSELTLDDPVWEGVTVVRGNCDYQGDFPIEQVKQVGEDTIYITHGHLKNVRFGLMQLMNAAAENDANIVFFGHTHMIGCEVVKGRLFLNPGSISQPRGPLQFQAYAIVDSEADRYDIQYYGRDFQPLPDLHFSLAKD